MHVSFELNALFTTGQTFAALAIDTDDNPARAAASGRSARVAPPDGAPGLPLTSSGWEVLHVFEQGDPDTTLIDMDTNRIEGIDPAAAGHALASPGGHRHHRGAQRVQRRVPRARRERTGGSRRLQAAALSAAGGGDVSAFGYRVRTWPIWSGASRGAPAWPRLLRARLHLRLHHRAGSRRNGRAGLRLGRRGLHGRREQLRALRACPGAAPPRGCSGNGYRRVGRYQPYGLDLPAGPAPHGLQLRSARPLARHTRRRSSSRACSSASARISNRILVVAARPRAVRLLLGQLGARRPRRARRRAGELRRSIPSGIFASGYSMGGYGTYYFAALYPQLSRGSSTGSAIRVTAASARLCITRARTAGP